MKKNHLSIELKDDWISLIYPYNAEYNNLVKRAAGSGKWMFDGKIKKWKVKPVVIYNVLIALSKFGADISNAVEQLNNMDLSCYLAEEEVESVEKLCVKPIKQMLHIRFPYCPEAVNAIKSLKYSKWIPQIKVWEILKVDSKILHDQIKDYLDTSELEKYLDYGKEKNLIIPENLERKPYFHQIEGAKFLLKNRRSILADEMGTGKTLSSILAVNSLPSPRLIVCPASLKLNWVKEIRTVDTNGTVKILSGYFEVADWIIINYEVLSKYLQDILKENINCVIFDEAHYLKAIDSHGMPASKRAEAGLNICKSMEYVFLLTGTPMTSRPKDLFNLLFAINHPLAKSKKDFYEYGQQYCAAENNGYGWDYRGASNTNELHDKIKKYMLRRYKKDLLELPDKIRSFVPVEVDLKKYIKAVETYVKKKKSFKSKKEHMVHFNTMRHILAKTKIKKTIELIENILENDEPVVIFTNFTAVVDEICNHFKEKAVKLTGDCSLGERQRAVEDFQNGEKDVFVANLVAGGVGITLTRANQVIINDFDWVPANHSQAEDRIHRIGTTRNCSIQYIYASGAEIDETMVDVLAKKINNISTVVDGGIGEDEIMMIEEILKVF